MVNLHVKHQLSHVVDHIVCLFAELHICRFEQATCMQGSPAADMLSLQRLA